MTDILITGNKSTNEYCLIFISPQSFFFVQKLLKTHQQATLWYMVKYAFITMKTRYTLLRVEHTYPVYMQLWIVCVNQPLKNTFFTLVWEINVKLNLR